MDDVIETIAETKSQAVVVEKSHGPVMEMTEMVQWMNTNFGTLGIREAMEQAAFMLCCDVIAQDIAKSTLRLRKKIGINTSVVIEANDHPIAAMLALEPNRRHTWYEYKEMTAYWMCFSQNSLAGVIRNNLGDPLELLPFMTNRVMEKVDGRDIFYDVSASTMQEQALLGAPFRTFHERDMIHVRGRLIDGMDGYSTMIAGRRTLETAQAIGDFRDTLFGEEGQIRGVFTRDQPGVLDEVAFQRLRSQFRILMDRFRAGVEPVVLEGGLKFDPIASKPQDLELSKQFISQIEETCRLLRVPPHKVFQMDGAKYENLETQEKMYVGDTLVPVCERFEQRYERVLLSRKDRLAGLIFEHDRDEMTLRDTQRETERVIRALERGAIEWDEARAKLGWGPLPNGQGQFRMVPANMTIIGRDGKVVLQGSNAPDKGGDGKGGDGKTDGAGDTGDPSQTEAGKKALRLISSN
ncbi:phage portal protein [Mesorhizobium silamurunense]|uniref:phage portal protein n=1 Tax=Mesorhizobium silamurunense TaxID=499528 RepID=UPI00177FB9B8|nr:phage portal protein [Mesorhizobium silamurunense]